MLGLVRLMTLPLMIVVILASWLWPGIVFAEPIYQNLATLVSRRSEASPVLCWLVQRHRRAALALAGLNSGTGGGLGDCMGAADTG